MNPTEHELRILRYLDQRGDTNRSRLVADIASPESRIGRGIFNGSNSAIPMISERWVKRLRTEGFLVESGSNGSHQAYRITKNGSKLIRTQERKVP